MRFDLIDIPNRINTTDIQMKLYEIIHLSHDKPKIKEKLMECLDMVEKIRKDADDWKTVFFRIANGIN